ncbi:MAG: hypothetical protein ABI614_07420 [Planctomycetota bacterium]
MADGLARKPLRLSRTICLSVTEEEYEKIVRDPKAFRLWVTQAFEESPELFPKGFTAKFHLKDRRLSKKQQLTIRRIQLPARSMFERGHCSGTLRPGTRP